MMMVNNCEQSYNSDDRISLTQMRACTLQVNMFRPSREQFEKLYKVRQPQST